LLKNKRNACDACEIKLKKTVNNKIKLQVILFIKKTETEVKLLCSSELKLSEKLFAK